jgi:hypothetical protein
MQNTYNSTAIPSRLPGFGILTNKYKDRKQNPGKVVWNGSELTKNDKYSRFRLVNIEGSHGG